MENNNLRLIPKMDDFLEDSFISEYKGEISYNGILRILREEIQELRNLIKEGGFSRFDKAEMFEYVKGRAVTRLDAFAGDRLKRVINATGIIIHTNLGRSPLSEETMDRVKEVVCGYNNLEYSVAEHKRRSRIFYIEEILKDLTGAEAALVVNNNAAAVFLALNTLCKNKEIIVSRGEIVEIGDSFRISEIINESGCVMKEVGTTNKTKLSDYEGNINENTALLLKVHTSNFKIVGFTGECVSSELVSLKKAREVIVMEDMGSGIIADLSGYGINGQRTVSDAVKDGVDIITFSGDKMLGGAQAGIIVGKKEYIDRMKKNQMLRCLRVDKMCLVALEVTLRQYFSEAFLSIPVIKGLLDTPENVKTKALRLNALLENIPGICSLVKPHYAMSGGGALPGENIDSFGVYLKAEGIQAADFDAHLRRQKVPVITTIQNEEIIIDVRTVNEKDFLYIKDIICEL